MLTYNETNFSQSLNKLAFTQDDFYYSVDPKTNQTGFNVAFAILMENFTRIPN